MAGVSLGVRQISSQIPLFPFELPHGWGAQLSCSWLGWSRVYFLAGGTQDILPCGDTEEMSPKPVAELVSTLAAPS